jgi:hypothetical protein
MGVEKILSHTIFCVVFGIKYHLMWYEMFSNEFQNCNLVVSNKHIIKMCKCIQAYEYKRYFDGIVKSSNSSFAKQIPHIFMAML